MATKKVNETEETTTSPKQEVAKTEPQETVKTEPVEAPVVKPTESIETFIDRIKEPRNSALLAGFRFWMKKRNETVCERETFAARLEEYRKMEIR